MRYVIGAVAALLLGGSLMGQAKAADLLSGNEGTTVQLTVANLDNVIASSPVSIGGMPLDGGSAGFTTGDISGLSQENTGGVNVMMVNTGTLSSQQSVVSTSVTIGDLPEIQSLIAGATGTN